MSVFEFSDRTKKYQAELLDFMDKHVYPAEAVYEEQMRESGNPHFQPPIIDDLKKEAKARGLWNLFHPHPEWGPGLTNLEYAPLAEIMGRSHLASRGHQLRRSGHGKHGGAHALRHRRAQGEVPQAASRKAKFVPLSR